MIKNGPMRNESHGSLSLIGVFFYDTYRLVAELCIEISMFSHVLEV